MTIKTPSRLLTLALLVALPLVSRATPIQPVVITNWYSGINDASTLSAETGSPAATGRHVQWKDTELKPIDSKEVMGLDQFVGVIQYRPVPPIQAHGLFSFNDVFGAGVNQMPSNSVITDSKLWLYVTSFASTQTITVAGLSPANKNWSESSACYSYQSNTTAWVGGDFAGAILKTYNTIANPTNTGWKAIDVAEPIKDYVTNVIGGIALMSQGSVAPLVQNAYYAANQHETPGWTPGLRSTYWLLYSPNPLAASDIWAEKFTANWENVLAIGGTVTNYHLDVATDPRFNNPVGIYSHLEMGAATSCVITGLTENTTYYYRLHCHFGRVVSFYNATTLVQTRRLQTLVFPPIAPQWVGDVVTLHATTESGLTPAFTVTDGPGIVSGGNLMSFSGTGLVTVVASQAGDAAWDPALPTVTNTVLVYNLGQTIAFPSLGTNRNTEIKYLGATASSGLPVTFSMGSGPGLITSGNVLTFTGTGVVEVVASQEGNLYYAAAPSVTNACLVWGTETVVTGNAGLTLSGLSQVYDGQPRPVTITTTPSDLQVVTNYNGIPFAPVDAGEYDVFAWVTNSSEYFGTIANVLTVNKGMPIVTNFLPQSGSAFETTNIVALSAQVSSGLTPVTYSVESGPGTLVSSANLGFTGEGTVVVRATQIGDANWYGASALSTVTVTKAAAQVVLTGLSQTYNGTPLSVGASTVPAGMIVHVTYDGDTTPPSHVGSYTVIAAIVDQLYSGVVTNTLIIGKGTPTIHFPQIRDQYITRTVHLAATSDSGQPVTFDLLPDGPGSIALDGTTLTFSATGAVSVVATDPLGDLNWFPASVTNTFAVHDVLVWLAGTNGQLVASGEAATFAKGTDFGAVGLTRVHTNQFSFGNETATPLSPVSWTTNGSGAAAFEVVGFASTVSAGGVSNLIVRFTPPGIGVYTAAVVIVHSGPTNTPFTLALSGTGATAATVGFIPSSLAFTTGYGTGPDDQQLILTNSGVVASDYVITLSSGSEGWLQSSTPMAGSVAGHGSAALSLGASAVGLDVGVYYGTATVHSVEAVNSPQSIPVTLTITQALASVSLADLHQVYDGNPKTVASWTTPLGLAVEVAYDGGAIAPSAVGIYDVTGTINDLNYFGSGTGLLHVVQGAALVSLGDLVHIYDRGPHPATVVTTPADLPVVITYDGAATIPSNAGVYTVTGTVNDPLYEGSMIGSLTIYKADQLITFLNPGAQETTNRVGLYATATSDFTVLFNVLSGPAVISGMTNLTFTGVIDWVSIVASQPGDGNWNPAPNVTNSFPINPPPEVYITFPTNGPSFLSLSNRVTVGGTAFDIDGLASVTVRNNRDVLPLVCSGTTSWQYVGLPLYQGTNYITATAYDVYGNSSTDLLVITYFKDKLYDDALRAGALMQDLNFPDNLTAGDVVTVQWQVLSYVPLLSRVYAGMPGSWSFYKNARCVGQAESAWNLNGRHATIYSYECDWPVPQKTGDYFNVWFACAQMDGAQYIVTPVPEGVDARVDPVYPRLLRRTILPGGSEADPASDLDNYDRARRFEGFYQQRERAGAVMTKINMSTNLIRRGSTITCEWWALSYFDLNAQFMALNVNSAVVWSTATGKTIPPKVGTSIYRLTDRETGAFSDATEYHFKASLKAPRCSGVQQFMFRWQKKSEKNTSWMGINLPSGIDPLQGEYDGMYGRFIERTFLP